MMPSIRESLLYLIFLNLVYITFVPGCVFAPRVIQIPTTSDLVRPNVNLTSDYPQMLAAVTSVMWGDLKLPPAEGVVTFYFNGAALESGLLAEYEKEVPEFEKQLFGIQAKEAFRAKLLATVIEDFDKRIEKESEKVKEAARAELLSEFDKRFEKEFGAAREAFYAKNNNQAISLMAREKATTAVAVGMHKRILVNQTAFFRYPWSERMRVLAHELTHTVQNAAAGGRRMSADLWLLEGFAEWVAFKVLDTLNIESSANGRERTINAVAIARQYQTFPGLSQLVMAPQWQSWARNLGREATYNQAYLAVDFLIEQKGFPAMVEYFQLYGRSNNREENFTIAFGEPVSVFEEKFSKHLQSLLGK